MAKPLLIGVLILSCTVSPAPRELCSGVRLRRFLRCETLETVINASCHVMPCHAMVCYDIPC